MPGRNSVQRCKETEAALTSVFKFNMIYSCLLSYFPTFRILYGREFGNEFLIMAAHGTLDGFVLLQTFQCLLT